MLFTAWTGVSFDDPHVAVQPLEAEGDDVKHRILIEGASNARYAVSGHIVYARAETLYAAPFDINRLEVTGSPVPLIEGVVRSQFDFSRNGSLAYIHAGAIEQSTLVWVDRKGTMEVITRTRRPFMMPRISPDGTQMALNIFDGDKHDVWIYVFAQDTFSRLTFENGNAYALWTPDGQHLTFSSDRDGPVNVFWKAADGSGTTKRLVKSDTIHLPSSWSPDGHFLAMTEIHPKTAGNIWLLSMDDERPPIPFLDTTFDEYEAVFSPDGRWLAYVSNESGQDEIYVRSYPGPGGKVQISSGGGMGPLWAPGGKELFYLNDENMISVAIETEPVLKVSDSTVLFATDFKRFSLAGFRNHDITPDGERFVGIKGDQEKAPTRIHIVLNWFEELKRLCPTEK
jgi:serine/threonine-protein kinase